MIRKPWKVIPTYRISIVKRKSTIFLSFGGDCKHNPLQHWLQFIPFCLNRSIFSFQQQNAFQQKYFLFIATFNFSLHSASFFLVLLKSNDWLWLSLATNLHKTLSDTPLTRSRRERKMARKLVEFELHSNRAELYWPKRKRYTHCWWQKCFGRDIL